LPSMEAVVETESMYEQSQINTSMISKKTSFVKSVAMNSAMGHHPLAKSAIFLLEPAELEQYSFDEEEINDDAEDL